MNGTKFLEDHILLHLLAHAKKDTAVPKAMFAEYRQACTHLLNEVFQDLDDHSRKVFFRAAFLEFWHKVTHAGIKAPLKEKLVFYLLNELGAVQANHDIPVFEKEVPKKNLKLPRYLESEILVQLIRKQHHATKNHLSKEFEGPILGILEKRYGSMYDDPLEVYGIAMVEGILYIEEGRLKSRIKSRLLTFFTRIAQYKLINNYKQEKRRLKVISRDELTYIDAILKTPDDYPEPDVDDGKQDSDWPIYRGVTRRELTKALETLKPIQRRYLEMFVIENLSYREMKEKVLEETEEEKSEGALRKAVFDSLKKVREILNSKKNGK